MKVNTTRFGLVEVPEKDVVFFPIGVLGFPDIRRYVILDHDRESPLKWLQAMDRPELAFPIVAPAHIVVQYHVTISPDDLATLALEGTEDVELFVILTIPHGVPARTTANLKAPIVMNPRAKLARQVLTIEEYPIRHPLSADEPATVECAG